MVKSKITKCIKKRRTDIEDLYYSNYRTEYIDGQKTGNPSKLILYFRDRLWFIELGIDELDNPTIFCELYGQLYHIPAPSFDSKTWDAFKKMLFEWAHR
jgi:hypothetical protein